FGSYRYVERVFLILTLPFLAYPIAALLGHPSWSKVATQTALPHLLGSRTFLVVVVALIGTTITPYMQLYQAAAVADRGTGVDNYRAARRDAITGSIFCNLISMTIIVATAAAIGGSGPLNSTKQAALALEPVVGSAATTLFAIGLLGASALAAAVVPLSTAYAIAEAVGAERSVSRRFREAPLFLGLFTGQIVIGVVIALAPGNLIDLLINTQILNGVISPIFLTFILILAKRRSLLGTAANSPRFRAIATICVGMTATLAMLVVAITVGRWL
ncbi:MAG: NRAMP family divalent metal transporter, partial [Ilumatobacteraceae bacterium]